MVGTPLLHDTLVIDELTSVGTVIVTTPHTLAIKDAVKGINMFRKVEVPILGLVQNMSTFTCPHCHTPTEVFGSDESVRKICADGGIDYLGNIPLHPAIGDDAHRGKPTVVAEPDSERAEAFTSIAKTVGDQIGLSR
jgi:ATP-binding protein involved in chromosome partitioning